MEHLRILFEYLLYFEFDCSAFRIKSINPFYATISFYIPWKRQKTRRSDVFRVYRKRPVAWNTLTNFSSFYSELVHKQSITLSFEKKVFRPQDI